MIFRKKSPPKKAVAVETVDVLWCCEPPPEIIESQFSHDYCRKTSRQLCRTQLNLLSWQEPDTREQLYDALKPGALTADALLMVTHPELVLSPAAVKRMMMHLDSGAGAVLPVFNDTPVSSQIAGLPGIYLNLSTYLEVAQMMADVHVKPSVPGGGSGVDGSCVLIPRDSVQYFASHLATGQGVAEALASFLSHMADQKHLLLDGSALVHSFGNYYSEKREELAVLVPGSAKNILDVGCANGGFGELMRSKRSDIHLTGVEMNDVMARNASPHYDRIHTMKVEDVRFESLFDHINCGDIIEHLYDPWQMLKLFSSLLKKGGSFVVSLPNAGHWSIVKDLAAGEFQYLPVGLLCMTHIRWFTEKSIREALGEAGLEIEEFRREQVPPTPQGEAFIQLLCQNGMGDRPSLLTNQFTIRAWKR